MEPSDPSEIIAGRYRLGDAIGRGGMATIFRAADLNMMDRTVAVKILREVYSNDPKFVTRFQREARAASALQHPNIVQVFDYGQSGDSYFIVMEFIDGMDLRRYLKRRGVPPVDRAVEIARDVSLGLGAAHRRGIVHRDVKPQNVMVNDEGMVKLTDFGIASMYKDADAERLTTTGMTLGTVQYYAPEQAQGEMVRPSADVYALGIVMYEMLTGQTPFEGDTPVAVAMKHIQELPQPPSELNPRIPPSLERIILRCLEKDPQARFRDGDALAAALDNFMRAPARRPGVISGANEAVGPYGAMARETARPAQGYPSGPRPDAYRGPASGPASGPSSGPRGMARGPMSVNGRPGLPMGGMGPDQMVDDYEPLGRAGPTGPWGPVGETRGRMGVAEPPRRNGPLIMAIVASVVVLLLVGGFLAFALSSGFGQIFATGNPTPAATAIPNVKVPTILNMTCADAQKALDADHLKLDCTQKKASDKPENTIIDQQPLAGQSVKEGSTVVAFVSAGKQTVPVPQVTGKYFQDACDALTKAQLTCSYTTQYDATVPINYVISSNPAEGTKAPVGTTVTLIISGGPQPTPTATQGPPTPVPTTPPTAVPTACPTTTGTPVPPC